MKQRDDTMTPETEDAWSSLDRGSVGTAYVKNVMRSLEMERNAARAVAKQLQEALQHAWSYPLTGSWYSQATEALDNARKKLP